MQKLIWVGVMVLVCANSAWAGSKHEKSKKKAAPREKPGATAVAKKKKPKKASFFADMKQVFVPPSGKDAADFMGGAAAGMADDETEVDVKGRGVRVKGKR